MIAVNSLGFRYSPSTQWLFRNLSFALSSGQAMALLGPNGRGKTTLLKCLAGLLRPAEGTVQIGPAVSYVPQHFSAPFAYSVRDIVLMGRARHVGVFAAPTRSDRQLADDALASLGLTAFAERPITQLSGGEQQLVLIARALASGASLMLLDEPTASLDFHNQALVLSTVRRLSVERGLTVVFTSHEPAHAAFIADRALLLHGPDTYTEGPAAEVLTERNLTGLYGVRIRYATVHGGNRALRTIVADLV